MYMIWHKMTFYDLYSFITAQLFDNILYIALY